MKNTKLTIAVLTLLVTGSQALAATTSVTGSKHYAPVRQHHISSKAHANKTAHTRSHHTSEAHAKKSTTTHKTPAKSKSGVSNKTAPRKTSGKLALPLNQ